MCQIRIRSQDHLPSVLTVNEMAYPKLDLDTGVSNWVAVYSDLDCSNYCGTSTGECDFCGKGASCCHLLPPHQNTDDEHQKMCPREQINAVLNDWFSTNSKASCVVKEKDVETVQYEVGKDGENCWGHCGAKAGPCDWCGENGFCCSANHHLVDSDNNGVPDCTIQQVAPLVTYAQATGAWNHICSVLSEGDFFHFLILLLIF